MSSLQYPSIFTKSFFTHKIWGGGYVPSDTSTCSTNNAGVTFGCNSVAPVNAAINTTSPPELRPFFSINFDEHNAYIRNIEKRYNKYFAEVDNLLIRELDLLCENTNYPEVYQHLRNQICLNSFPLNLSSYYDLFSNCTDAQRTEYDNLKNKLKDICDKKLTHLKYLDDSDSLSYSPRMLRKKLSLDLCLCSNQAIKAQSDSLAEAILLGSEDKEWYKNNKTLFDDAMTFLLAKHKSDCIESISEVQEHIKNLEDAELNLEKFESDFWSWQADYLKRIRENGKTPSFKYGDVNFMEATCAKRLGDRDLCVIFEMLDKEIDQLCPPTMNEKVNSELKKLHERKNIKLNDNIENVLNGINLEGEQKETFKNCFESLQNIFNKYISSETFKKDISYRGSDICEDSYEVCYTMMNSILAENEKIPSKIRGLKVEKQYDILMEGSVEDWIAQSSSDAIKAKKLDFLAKNPDIKSEIEETNKKYAKARLELLQTECDLYEWNKDFAKRFPQKHKLPTARLDLLNREWETPVLTGAELEAKRRMEAALAAEEWEKRLEKIGKQPETSAKGWSKSSKIAAGIAIVTTFFSVGYWYFKNKQQKPEKINTVV